MHQLKRLVDLIPRHDMDDEIVDVDLAIHVPVDDVQHVGAPLGAAERRAAPERVNSSVWQTPVDLMRKGKLLNTLKHDKAVVGAVLWASGMAFA